MKNEENKQDVKLRMDRIVLTEDVIEAIHFLQTCGFTQNHIVAKSDFDNHGIDYLICEITKVMDLLIQFYGGTEPADKTVYLDRLDILRFLKEHLDSFRVTLPVE